MALSSILYWCLSFAKTIIYLQILDAYVPYFHGIYLIIKKFKLISAFIIIIHSVEKWHTSFMINIEETRSMMNCFYCHQDHKRYKWLLKSDQNWVFISYWFQFQ